jgi:phosphoribosyl 1,2-cyclic phosphate phosphodiesterase
MRRTLRILGCGSSGGVPRVGQGWGACDPAEPRNRRRRCSILIRQETEAGATQLLVDTSPDLREQLLDAGIRDLDAVIFTHEHADHTHGIDDLRPLAIHNRRRMEVWCDERTSVFLRHRFDYCFATPPGSEYPPILNEHRLVAGDTTVFTGKGGEIRILPFTLRHGTQDCLGLRIGGTVYTPDVSQIPPESEQYLTNMDLWIIDSLRLAPHPSHFSLSEALYWIARARPRRAILTNLHTDLDYAKLARELPDHVVPAHDGLEVAIG